MRWRREKAGATGEEGVGRRSQEKRKKGNNGPPCQKRRRRPFLGWGFGSEVPKKKKPIFHFGSYERSMCLAIVAADAFLRENKWAIRRAHFWDKRKPFFGCSPCLKGFSMDPTNPPFPFFASVGLYSPTFFAESKVSKVNDGGEGGGSQGRAEVLLLHSERRGLGMPFFSWPSLKQHFFKTTATLCCTKGYT